MSQSVNSNINQVKDGTKDSSSAVKLAFLIVFFILLIYPFIQCKYKIIPEKKVGGATARVKKPKFSYPSFKTKDYQNQFTKWYSNRIGLRGILIKSHNQLNYSLFKDLNPYNQTKITLGNDNYLFEKSYLENYNRNNVAPKQVIDNLALKIKNLQSLLRKRKIEFQLVISPSKAEIYPEYIPSKYIHPNRLKRNDNHLEFVSALKSNNVQFIDAVSYFKSLKQQTKYPLFTKSGTHWSYYSACLVAKKITEEFQVLLNKKTYQVKCDPIKLEESYSGTDRDLLNLINIWDESDFRQEVAYPPGVLSKKNKVLDQPDLYRPTVLVEGDSFTWTILHFFDTQAIFRKRKFYYYNESEYNFWTTTKKGIIKKEISAKFPKGKVQPEWEAVLNERDAVLLFANQSVISSLGHGFVDNLISYLEASSQ